PSFKFLTEGRIALLVGTLVLGVELPLSTLAQEITDELSQDRKGRGISIPFSFGYDSNSVHHLRPGYYPSYGTVTWVSNDDYFAQGGWSNSIPSLRSDGWEQDVAVLTGYNPGQGPIYAYYPCYYQSNYVFR